ncbi:MAG: hypothetical protein KF773_30805 [Deltaproteobacteria bacterium]|nr:hypothetical protein [Deltaproteobacteria bacterium]
MKLRRRLPLGLRVCGYWLLYALVGVLVLAMLIAGAGDLGGGERNGIRDNTKVIAAASGLALGAATLGLFGVPSPLLAKLLAYAGFPLAAALSVWAWARLDADLRDR